MKKYQLKPINILFLVITFVLIILIFYISKILLNEDNKTSAIAPKKIKASNVTYSKTINLNQASANTEPTSLPSPSPTITVPTPTEIVLAYHSTDETPTPEITKEISLTSTQRITEIPQSGNLYQTLIIFASASIFIFFAFLF